MCVCVGRGRGVCVCCVSYLHDILRVDQVYPYVFDQRSHQSLEVRTCARETLPVNHRPSLLHLTG